MTDANGCPDAPHLPVDCPGDACRGAADGLRQRPEDQPLPVGNDRPGAHDQLIAALTARRELGLRRYGQLLQPHNGRNTGRDLVEELLDAVVYAQTLETELVDLRRVYRAAALTIDLMRATGVTLPALEVALGAIDGTPQPPAAGEADDLGRPEKYYRAAGAVLEALKRRGTAVTVQAAIEVVDAVAAELETTIPPAGVGPAAQSPHIDVVFDGPPGPDAGRFVEVEVDGRSVDVGEWLERDDDLWSLRITAADVAGADPDVCRIHPDKLFEDGRRFPWCVAHDAPAAHRAGE